MWSSGTRFSLRVMAVLLCSISQAQAPTPLREASSRKLDLTLRDLQQPELAGPRDGLGARGDAKLAEDHARVGPDRVEGDVELGRDLALRQAAGQQAQDVEL